MTDSDNPIKDSHLLASRLIDWYERNYRDLPWRNTRDPYRIWLSEIILQQTRVQQGLPYYQRFVNAYPTVQALAAAPEQEVLRLWQGLGYYSRARNLHACARVLVSDHSGQFPNAFELLQKLPGIGKYTAAAIASFAFGQAVPVVDGNVYRVLARLFGETTDIGSPAAFRVFFRLAQQLIDTSRPHLFNQAIMEFGALHCTPQKPLCLYCPLQQHCWAFAHEQQQALPVKEKKTKVRTRNLHYVVIASPEGKLLMRQRPAGDIWQGLFDFYLLETMGQQIPLQAAEQLEDTFAQALLLLQPQYEPSPAYRHQLTHQRLQVRFFSFRLSHQMLGQLVLPADMAWFSPEEIHNLPKPVLIQNYLKEAGF
ncbi:MAG: A/G-specific adenine glycosylase [Bacteroidetes bacterium]|nr:A/G-specific adenine glycosylase [Bacteroidota bacterium]